MRERDVVGKRIVGISQTRMEPDGEYYGPRIFCTQIYLDNGSYLTAHCYESTDQPIASIELTKPRKATQPSR